MAAVKFLSYRILDPDSFDLFIERREGVTPSKLLSVRAGRWTFRYLPFFGRDHFDYSRLHTILVNLANKVFEASKLFDCLEHTTIRSLS